MSDRQWKDINEAPSGRAVLVYYKNILGKGRVVKAEYIEKLTVESNYSDCECDEYCEEDGEYYLVEGWYEMIDNWCDYTSVAIVEGEPTHWMLLPSSPDTAGRERS